MEDISDNYLSYRFELPDSSYPAYLSGSWDFEKEQDGGKEYLWLLNKDQEFVFSSDYDMNRDGFLRNNFNFDAYLHAPDYTIENIKLDSNILTFDIKNIGNSKGEVMGNSEGYVTLYGYTSDSYTNYNYANINYPFGDISINLDPGESKSFRIEWPGNDYYGSCCFSDSKYFKITISPKYPDSFIQSDYDNDDTMGLKLP